MATPARRRDWLVLSVAVCALVLGVGAGLVERSASWWLIGASWWLALSVIASVFVGRIVRLREQQVPLAPPTPLPSRVDPAVVSLLRESIAERPDTGRPRGSTS